MTKGEGRARGEGCRGGADTAVRTSTASIVCTSRSYTAAPNRVASDVNDMKTRAAERS